MNTMLILTYVKVDANITILKNVSISSHNIRMYGADGHVQRNQHSLNVIYTNLQ